MASFTPPAASLQAWQQRVADEHAAAMRDAYFDGEESDSEPIEPIRRCFSAPSLSSVASQDVPATAAGRAGRTPPPPASESTSAEDPRTTAMLRNLPYTLSRSMLVDILNAAGMGGKYNLVYVPFDFATRQNLGYAFVNMTGAAEAQELFGALDGYSRWPMASQKMCCVCWSHRQGLRKNVRFFASSTLLHESVPEAQRPVLFEGGQAVPFPVPLRHVPRPRRSRA